MARRLPAQGMKKWEMIASLNSTGGTAERAAFEAGFNGVRWERPHRFVFSV